MKDMNTILNGPRITDGLCPVSCTCTTAPRVSSKYVEGRGDKRVIVDDEGLLQDLLFGAIEELRIALTEAGPSILDRDTYTFTSVWLVKATYSLSAFIHCVHKGEKVIDRHTLPQEANAYLDINWGDKTHELMPSIINWKQELGSKQEFGHYPGGAKAKGARLLDLCRVKARKVQTLYRAWRSHHEEIGGHAQTLDQALIFLNRLSTYFEWAARHEAKLNGVEVELWESQMPPFPVELIS